MTITQAKPSRVFPGMGIGKSAQDTIVEGIVPPYQVIVGQKYAKDIADLQKEYRETGKITPIKREVEKIA